MCIRDRLSSLSESVFTWNYRDYLEYQRNRLFTDSILQDIKIHCNGFIQIEQVDSLCNMLEQKEYSLLHIMRTIKSKEKSDSLFFESQIPKKSLKTRTVTRKKKGLAGFFGKTETIQEPYYVIEYSELKKKTKENPTWVHFGAGNIFRAFPAAKLQDLLNLGEYDRGVVVAESFDHEIITKAYKPYDGLSLSVVLKAEGTIEKHVVGSVTESLVADPVAPEDYARLTEIFENPSLQMVTFTITEKGYSLVNGKGEKLPGVEDGFLAGPGNQSHLMGRIASLCYTRFVKNGTPLALVSTDNCSHNGDKLKAGVMAYVDAWKQAGKVDDDFVSYMEEKVSFPWSMIDKITPRPDEKVKEMLEKDGFEDTDLIITSRNTYTAPFVNSEETGYLVIEDNFPNGRPPLEKAGIVFTDRETVDKVEKMKVCTCLNPLHTALAIYGCMLGHTSIHDEMEDKELSQLIQKMCYEEAMPVVVNPGVIAVSYTHLTLPTKLEV